jgi:acetylornithine/succinyldiaminopimelate/putrescine aminotransferase
MAGIVLVGAMAIFLAGFAVGLMLATAYVARRKHRASHVSQPGGGPLALARSGLSSTGAERGFVVRPS